MSENTQTTALAPRQMPAALAPKWRMVPTSLGEAMEMAKLITSTELCPKAYRGKPQDAIVAYEFGQALGMSWLQSLRNVASINGIPSLYGDALPAVIMGTGECTRFKEWIEGEGDQRTAHCIIGRKGYPDEFHKTFSVAEAKVAKLWGKTGRDGQPTPWITYPDRMLQWRATGFTGRAAFPDKLSGLILVEEAQDIEADRGDSIPGTVVESVVVDPMDRIPEGMRENVGKAFETMNLAPGLRIAKINEFLGAEGVTPEDGAAALLEWCRDEFAKRKTGQPRARKSNDKPKGTPAADAGSAPAAASGGASGAPAKDPANGSGTGAPAPAQDAAVVPAQSAGRVDAQPPAVTPPADNADLF